MASFLQKIFKKKEESNVIKKEVPATPTKLEGTAGQNIKEVDRYGGGGQPSSQGRPTSISGSPPSSTSPPSKTISRGGSSGGGGGGGGISRSTPTEQAEQALAISPPSNLRNQSIQEVKGQQQRQSLAKTPQMDTTQSMQKQAAYAQQQYIPATSFGGQTTRTNLTLKRDFPVYSPGKIYQVQEGIAGKDKFGREIPLVATYAVGDIIQREVGKTTEVIGDKEVTTTFTEKGYEGYTSRKATPSEREFLGSSIKAKTYEATALGLEGGLKIPKTKIEQIYGKTKGKIQEISQYEIGRGFLEQPLEKASKSESKIIRFLGKVGDGIIPDTTGEYISTGISFGIGAGIGAGTRLTGAALRTAKLTQKAAPYIEKGISGGLGIAGAVYLGGKGLQIYSAKNAEEKGYLIGSTIREIGALGAGGYIGSKIVSKGVGYYRTRGLKELPEESVIAREYYEGQKFPQIKKGQTAGELRKEFYESVLPGETKGVSRGFSARPIPLMETVGTGKVRGGELEGSYYAPGVNPYFFRGGNYPKLFSLGEFGRLPTIERTAFEGIKYGPGVRGSQRNLRKQFTKEEIKTIRESTAGTGKATLGFIKAEKEVVLSPEQRVTPPTKRYYIRDPLTSERVPIYERATIKEKEFIGFKKTERLKDIGTTLPKRPSLLTGSRITGGYSRGLKGSSSYSKVPKYSSSAYSKVSSSIGSSSNISSYAKSNISKSSLTSKKSSSSTSNVYSSLLKGSSTLNVGSYVATSSSLFRGSGIPSSIIGSPIGGGDYGRTKGIPSKYKKPRGLSPSLYAVVKNIRGPLEFKERTGLEIRPIPKSAGKNIYTEFQKKIGGF